MSVPSLSTADFNEEGFFMHTRAIERLALAVQALGGALGDNNSTQGDKPFTLGLPPGIYNPSNVEVGGDGNIKSISAAIVSSSRPGSHIYLTNPGIFRTVSSNLAAGTVYPFELYSGSFTNFGDFPILSFTGSGTSAALTGFDAAKTYFGAINISIGVTASGGTGVRSQSYTMEVRDSSGGTPIAVVESFDGFPGALAASSRRTITVTFIFTGTSSIYLAIPYSASWSASASHSFVLSTSVIDFIQLD